VEVENVLLGLKGGAGRRAVIGVADDCWAGVKAFRRG